ncbi:hypothetical protein NYA22BAC_00457 [Parasphingorhabdus sp. NYA22]
MKPDEMIAKARREMDRLAASADDQKSDHAMNAALTISHILEWIFHATKERGLEVGNRSDFLDAARSACGPLAQITDIANASKHFELTRARTDATAVGDGKLVLFQDLMLRDIEPPHMPSAGKVAGIRTIIDDDEIVGFETIVTGQRIDAPSGPTLFEVACDDALDSLIRANDSIQNDKLPEWLTTEVQRG